MLPNETSFEETHSQIIKNDMLNHDDDSNYGGKQSMALSMVKKSSELNFQVDRQSVLLSQDNKGSNMHADSQKTLLNVNARSALNDQSQVSQMSDNEIHLTVKEKPKMLEPTLLNLIEPNIVDATPKNFLPKHTPKQSTP